MIPVEDILEALDLSRAQPGSGFLEALFSRFNARVPFENASKIVRNAEVAELDARPRTPDVFWEDHLERGAGGACFARVAAFDALLTELGFTTRRRLGRVRNPHDHAALLVDTPAGEMLVDVGFPLPALVPARSGLVESAAGALRVESTASGLAVAYEGGVPEGPRSLEIFAEPVSPEEYAAHWRRTFAADAPFLKEVSMRRDLGNRVLSFARGEVRVDDLHSRLRIPIAAPRAPRLASLFEIDETLLARAFSLAGDPDAAEAEATLTAYLEVSASPDEAFGAVASPGAYRRLLEGVAHAGEPRESARGFRIALSPSAGGEESRVEDEVLPHTAARRLDVLRRAGSSEQRSSYAAVERGGKTYLERQAVLSGVREDLLRNDSLRGRFAGTLAVDLLAWARVL